MGLKLPDAMPRLPKNYMVMNNPALAPQWRDAWKSREEAMRCKYTRNCEKFNQGTKELSKLEAGDSVIVQNQNGRHPTRWDKTGIVVEVLKFDQYIVRVNGSGRLTRRNRRFLRKFEQSPSIAKKFTDLVTPENTHSPTVEPSREQSTPRPFF